jgi:hypothetical protein
MSIFSSILKSLGINHEEPKAGAPATPAKHMVLGTPGKNVDRPDMPMVDVVSKLDGLAKTNPQKLDWKVSIVDLLKLLNLDSSFEARKGLATELGCPASEMGDSARMNIWLHKTVLQKISENGGNVPVSLYM